MRKIIFFSIELTKLLKIIVKVARDTHALAFNRRQGLVSKVQGRPIQA